VCGSSARTDLYGGQLAIAVPTVTEVTTIAQAVAALQNGFRLK
jgi:hypothetical protein